MSTSYISVTNGYPGTDVWVTVYQSVTGFGDREIKTSGAVNAGETQSFSWGYNGDGCYVRCETSTTILGKGYKFSDTTAEAIVGTDPSNVAQWTLLPEDEPRGTYLAQGKQPAGNINLNLSTGTQYLIQSAITRGSDYPTPTVCLSIDNGKHNPCVIADWGPQLGPSPGGIMNWIKQDCQYGFVLYNVGFDSLLYVDYGNGANPQLVPNTPLNQRLSLWTIPGNPTIPQGEVAIRPYIDDGQNLNVFGDGPYRAGSAVGTWAWGGGAPNEVWLFFEITGHA